MTTQPQGVWTQCPKCGEWDDPKRHQCDPMWLVSPVKDDLPKGSGTQVYARTARLASLRFVELGHVQLGTPPQGDSLTTVTVENTTTGDRVYFNVWTQVEIRTSAAQVPTRAVALLQEQAWEEEHAADH